MNEIVVTACARTNTTYLNGIRYDVRIWIINSIAKMLFSKRDQHDVDRRRSNKNRRMIGNYEVAGEVAPEASTASYSLKG